MKYELELTHQYLKDLKLARKRGLDENKLNEIIIKLINLQISLKFQSLMSYVKFGKKKSTVPTVL